MAWWLFSAQLKWRIFYTMPYTIYKHAEKCKIMIWCGQNTIYNRSASGYIFLSHKLNTDMLHRSWPIMFLVDWPWLSIILTRRVTLRLGWRALSLLYLSMKSKCIMGFMKAKLLNALEIHIVKQMNSIVSGNIYTFINIISYMTSFVYVSYVLDSLRRDWNAHTIESLKLSCK